VNKTELINEIAQKTDLSKAAINKILDALVEVVAEALKKEDPVSLVGFGTFYVGNRSERSGRNPRTGEPIKIAAAKTPRFRAGKTLKDAVN
jgi:DNA-binding protein HU-beta